jgi:hypothetical protein
MFICTERNVTVVFSEAESALGVFLTESALGVFLTESDLGVFLKQKVAVVCFCGSDRGGDGEVRSDMIGCVMGEGWTW